MYKVILFLFFRFTSFAQNCKMLEDGKYQMKNDNQNHDSSFFEINKNVYSTSFNGEINVFEIKTLSNCSFELKNIEVVDDSKMTEFERAIYRQGYYYEITKVEGNEYFFTCKVDLHIQCGSGKFIKLE